MSIRHLLLGFALMSMGLFACQTSSDELPDVSDPNNQAQSVTGTVNASQLLQLVNAYRRQGCTCGSDVMPAVPSLVWDDDLEYIAFGHSQDMADQRSMTHTGSDGSTARQRLDRAGYDWSTYGENIAWNYPNEAAVVEGWINSPGHCRNIMNAAITNMAVAQKELYWTQLLTRP